MTIGSVYKKALNLLSEKKIDDCEIEARLITEKIFSLNSSDFILKKDFAVTSEQAEAVISAVKKRIDGIPIQYILGEWDFMGLTFKVGDGVLIPRPETEILCEYAINHIKPKKKPVVYDLCSGSGCIGISVKYFKNDAELWLFEKSEKATEFIKENSKNLVDSKVNILLCDILKDEKDFEILPKADLIVSNPPYIKSNEIDFLQSEVQLEPRMALDGGDDGLIFYRRLADFWSDKLKADGVIAMECGEEQADEISKLFREKMFDTEIIKDYNEIKRIVIGKKGVK